jgi:NADPH:quinone reductase-like Zn-dependent oxidoreductase
MTTMRAITMAQTGGPEVLVATEVQKPTKVNAEFLVKVLAAGVNPIDAGGRGCLRRDHPVPGDPGQRLQWDRCRVSLRGPPHQAR